MQQIQSECMEGGFRSPVFDAQKAFNTLMNTMARPGLVGAMPSLASGPPPMFDTSAAVMMTLLDSDTAIWLAPSVASSSDISGWLSFHTGAPATEVHDEAQFAFAAASDELPDLAKFAQGSQEYPDRSTTLIIQVETLANGKDLSLSGPGIKNRTGVSIGEIPPYFLERWAVNNQRFPRGVDVIFTSRTSIMCLPRTTVVEQGET